MTRVQVPTFWFRLQYGSLDEFPQFWKAVISANFQVGRRLRLCAPDITDPQAMNQDLIISMQTNKQSMQQTKIPIITDIIPGPHTRGLSSPQISLGMNCLSTSKSPAIKSFLEPKALLCLFVLPMLHIWHASLTHFT